MHQNTQWVAPGWRYPGYRFVEVFWSPEGEVLRSPQGAKDEVASGGKGRGRRRGQRTRSLQDDGSQPGRQRGQITGSLQRGGMGYPGCRKDGGLQVTAEWRSPDRGRMEVSRSPQNGGLRIAAEWRSPGHRRMEVSRSPQDGGLQVAAKWRSSGRRGSTDHCGKVEVFVAIG